MTVIESFGQPGDKSRFPEVFTCPCFEQFSEPVAELSGTAERLDLSRSPLRAIFARPEPICGDYPLLVGKEFLCVAAAIAATVGVNLAHGAGRGYNARCREDRQSVGASWFDCQSNLIVRPSLPAGSTSREPSLWILTAPTPWQVSRKSRKSWKGISPDRSFGSLS